MIKVPRPASGALFTAFALGFVSCSLAVVAQTSPPAHRQERTAATHVSMGRIHHPEGRRQVDTNEAISLQICREQHRC